MAVIALPHCTIMLILDILCLFNVIYMLLCIQLDPSYMLYPYSVMLLNKDCSIPQKYIRSQDMLALRYHH